MEFLQTLSLMGPQEDIDLLKNGIAFCIGLAAHILRQMWVEQVSLREYLAGHKGRTFLSTGSLVGAFSFLSMSYPSAPLMIYLMGGYCIDSIMNKSPLSIKKLQNEKS